MQTAPELTTKDTVCMTPRLDTHRSPPRSPVINISIGPQTRVSKVGGGSITTVGTTIDELARSQSSLRLVESVEIGRRLILPGRHKSGYRIASAKRERPRTTRN